MFRGHWFHVIFQLKYVIIYQNATIILDQNGDPKILYNEE